MGVLSSDAARPDASSGERRGRVLVVDDDGVVRHLLTHLLDTDYVVGVAEDGQEALRVARSLRPDVVITDLLMPERSGWDLLAELRNDPALRDTRVVAISGAEDPPAEVLERGFDDYVSKPFEPDELAARVAVAFASRRRLARLRRLVDTLPVGVALLETNWRFAIVNDALVDMLGFASSEYLRQHTFPDLVVDADQRAQVIEAIRAQRPAQLVCTLATDFGSTVASEITLRPVTDAIGTVDGVALLVRALVSTGD